MIESEIFPYSLLGSGADGKFDRTSLGSEPVKVFKSIFIPFLFEDIIIFVFQANLNNLNGWWCCVL